MDGRTSAAGSGKAAAELRMKSALDSEENEQTLGAIPAKSDWPAGNAQLISAIRREIEASGTITFARFMELALYHPRFGYYASGRARIGRAGDFFTNVSVGAIFGKLLALQFAELWEKLGRPGEFTIVEQGAHDGQFAADVLSALHRSDCFPQLRYIIVEPFPVWRKRQQEKLTNFFGKVAWRELVTELEPFTGIHFSNELFDALPVHLVESEGGDWRELFVTLNSDEFGFEERSCSGGLRPSTAVATDRHYKTDLNPAAPKLMREIASKLLRGVILTIDYGFAREEFYSAERATGTLQIRAKHKKLASPFEQIGSADISAHVEWTSLIEAAQSAGANTLGFTDQHHFFTGIVCEMTPAQQLEFSLADKRSLQTLLHPEMLGRTFQVLALAKNFAGSLSGFQFARACRVHGVNEP
jgi:SAM-dependent MidA family methyltransferase